MLVPACNEKHFKEHVILTEIFPDDFTTDSGKQLKCLTTTERVCPQLLDTGSCYAFTSRLKNPLF